MPAADRGAPAGPGRRSGVAGSLLRRLHGGYAQISATVGPYAEFWRAVSDRAMATGDGPLLVALGDSTAQGIGASRPELGYVGGLVDWLTARTGQPWRVVNLSASGARAGDVLAGQLPALGDLGRPPDLVTLAVGANDIVRRTPMAALQAALSALVDQLPAGSVVGTIPQGLGRRPALVNEFLARRCAERELVVADVWGRTGPPWAGKFAADSFHPNDHGYRNWLAAFTEALEHRGPAGGRQPASG